MKKTHLNTGNFDCVLRTYVVCQCMLVGVWWVVFVCCGNLLCPVAVMSTSFGYVCSCTKIAGEACDQRDMFGLLSEKLTFRE